MRLCTLAAGLVLFPLALGILVGVMVSDHVLAAVERAQRERRREAAKRVTRDMTYTDAAPRNISYTEAANAEARWFCWESAVHGRVLEWVCDGGATINVRR